ncbi:unnamed protein product [Thlaspi arvense]|uniref:C2H2-type domain-containing protein n=1 Tax=Thlaspi arvense TaxID=13288 RepID=A0AAU9SWP1_THLAR|nr:unnamed protein product [Thlaspi arvense]
MTSHAFNSYKKGKLLNALEIINESRSVQGNGFDYDFLEGVIFEDLGEETKVLQKKITYAMGSLECFSRIETTHKAKPLFKLAELIGSKMYYKKFSAMAEEGLKIISSVLSSQVLGNDNGVYTQLHKEKEELEMLIKTAKSRIADPETLVPCPVECKQEHIKGSKKQEEKRRENHEIVEDVRARWEISSVGTKRSYMKVSIADLRLYVREKFRKAGEDALEQVLAYAKKKQKWKVWICRTCPKKFTSCEECRSHLEQEHGAKLKLSSRVSEVWADKVSVGVWKPVDAEAAVEMMKKDVKAFEYQDGWCKEWPLAEDEERSEVLDGIRSLLVSFRKHKILSEGIRNRMIDAVVTFLGKLKVSKQTVTDCGLLGTPKSICFLEYGELNKILDLLRSIKCKRHDGIDLVCSAVESYCGGTRVKEKMDFDSSFSFLLLDKRLLQDSVDGRPFDEEGKISFIDPSLHCARASGSGDAFLSWLGVYSSGDGRFRFPRHVEAHNLDFWSAALRAFQFTCRTLGTKHAKKTQWLTYGAALNDAKELCATMNPQGRQQNVNATLLRTRCEESETGDLFLCAVADVLSKESNPKLGSPDLKAMREATHLWDSQVTESIARLESVVNNKVARMESRILLIENSRIDLLNSLTRLCGFDYRCYIHPPLKEHLLARLDRQFP